MPMRLHLDGQAWHAGVPALAHRRQFLHLAAAGLSLWPFLGPPRTAFARQKIKLSGNPFQLGVASGDPTPDGFVIWTRLAPEPLTGGGMPNENLVVRWQVATDENLTNIVIEGTAVATPELAHAVHVEVPGLDPGRWYFYRFIANGEASPVGRARTAPRPGETPNRLRFAFASCQHWENGYFTGYEHMAQEDLDLVAHLGDYIYEGASRKVDPGAPATPKAAARQPVVRSHVGPLLTELAHYRNRHAQYKTDVHLQAAHRLFPWIVTWDDHEFANNCAGAISEKPDETTEQYLIRRAAAYQAYYEHMPLRAAQTPRGPDLTLYRRVSFGSLAEFAVLDTRQYRTDQPCGDGNKPPCPACYSEQATLLGPEQEQWMYQTLKNSPAKWNVLTQQVMMGLVDRKPGEEVAVSMDQWPGYEANRQRVLKFFAAHPKLNPIVITGDIHTNWVNDLQVNSANSRAPVVGTEFVGTSLTSGGDGVESAKDTAIVLAENPFVKFYSRERGYVSCDITPKQWTSHYRVLPNITRPGGPVVTRRSFVVQHGRPGAQQV